MINEFFEIVLLMIDNLKMYFSWLNVDINVATLVNPMGYTSNIFYSSLSKFLYFQYNLLLSVYPKTTNLSILI